MLLILGHDRPDVGYFPHLMAKRRKVNNLLGLAILWLGMTDPKKPEDAVKKAEAATKLASAVDFVLEGLYAQKKISRSDDRGYHAAEQPRRPSTRAAERDLDEGIPLPGGKKKYYN